MQLPLPLTPEMLPVYTHSGPRNLTTHTGLPTVRIIQCISGEGWLLSVSIMFSWLEDTVKSFFLFWAE